MNVSEEVQATELVRSCVVESLYVPVAVYCRVDPFGIEEVDGITAKDTSVGPLELSTRRFVVELCVSVPLVAVIVSVYAPVVAVALTTRFSVVDPDPVTVAGLNVGITPAGKPPTLNETDALNPPMLVTVDVKLVLAPWITFWEPGEVESEKSTVALTIRVTVEDCVRLPLVPVTVKV
jgi:hypothetical protein